MSALTYAGLAQGFEQGRQRRGKQRQEAARLFNEFKRANPDANFDDFMNFRQSVSGGDPYLSGSMPSQQQLQRFADMNQQRMAQEQRMANIKEMGQQQQIDGQFRKDLKKALLTHNGDTMAAFNATVDRYSAGNEDHKAALQEQYGSLELGKLYTEAENDRFKESLQAVKTMVEGGQKITDWESVVGYKPSPRMQQQLDGVVTMTARKYDDDVMGTIERSILTEAEKGNDILTGMEGQYLTRFVGDDGQQRIETLRNRVAKALDTYRTGKSKSLQSEVDDWLKSQQNTLRQLAVDQPDRPGLIDRLTNAVKERYPELEPEKARSLVSTFVETNEEWIVTEQRSRVAKNWRNDPQVAEMIKNGMSADKIFNQISQTDAYVDKATIENLVNSRHVQLNQQDAQNWRKELLSRITQAGETFDAKQEETDKSLFGQLAQMAEDGWQNVQVLGNHYSKMLSTEQDIITFVSQLAEHGSKGDSPDKLAAIADQIIAKMNPVSDEQAKANYTSAIRGVEPVDVSLWKREQDTTLNQQYAEIKEELLAYSRLPASQVSQQGIAGIQAKLQAFTIKLEGYETQAQYYYDNSDLDTAYKLAASKRNYQDPTQHPLVKGPASMIAQATAEIFPLLQQAIARTEQVSSSMGDPSVAMSTITDSSEQAYLMNQQRFSDKVKAQYRTDLGYGLDSSNAIKLLTILGNNASLYTPNMPNYEGARKELARLETAYKLALEQKLDASRTTMEASANAYFGLTGYNQEEAKANREKVKQLAQQIKELLGDFI